MANMLDTAYIHIRASAENAKTIVLVLYRAKSLYSLYRHYN